ncbi:hypothetical protein AMK59_4883, partial [Oryctes borbonicus]
MKICSALFSYTIISSAICSCCPTRLEEVIDITSGKQYNNVIVYNNMIFNSSNYFQYQGKTYGCVCSIKTCLTKCCPEGERLIDQECRKFDKEINIAVYKGTEMFNSNADNFYLIKTSVFDNICGDGYTFSLTQNEIDYYLQENGDLHTSLQTFTDKNMYCIDGNENGELIVEVCYMENTDEEMSITMVAGLECTEQPVMIPNDVERYIQENGDVYSSIGNFTDRKTYCFEGTKDSDLVILVCAESIEAGESGEMDEMMMITYYIG